MATLYTYSIYLSTSELLSFIISNSHKHGFKSIWKWICCCNDVMNHVDSVIKGDVYPQKMHSSSKIFVIYQFLFLKYPWYVKKIHTIGDIAWIFE